MLVLVACVALNIWLFRISIFLGLVGVNITKHVLIAWLCQVVGVDKRDPRAGPLPVSSVPAPSFPIR
jgi:hypothetical protein